MAFIAHRKNLFKGINKQALAIKLLESALNKNRVAPAYIFSGPQGVGQKEIALRFLEGLISGGIENTSLRRRLADFNYPDLLWVEPTYLYQGNQINKSIASQKNINLNTKPQIRLDQIRQIKSFLAKQTLEADIAMVVIEEAEAMNEAASNALLKTLEEPTNGILILLSSRLEKLISTIISRCQEIPFKPLRSNEINTEILNDWVSKEELIGAYKQELINLSNGSPEQLKYNINAFLEVPSDILPNLEHKPGNYLKALKVAKEITEKLTLDQQKWLINFLQEYFWLKEYNYSTAKKLEKLHSNLLSSIQPRVAWEVALIEISSKIYDD